MQSFNRYPCLTTVHEDITSMIQFHQPHAPLSEEFEPDFRYGMVNVKSRILRIKIETFFVLTAVASSTFRAEIRSYFPYTAKNFQLGRLASPETRQLNFHCSDKEKNANDSAFMHSTKKRANLQITRFKSNKNVQYTKK